MNQADGMVEMSFHQRETRMLAADGKLERALEWFVGIEHDHLVARCHHIAHPELVEPERVDENLAFGLSHLLRFAALRYEQREFFGGVRVPAFADRLNVEKSLEQPICCAIEDADRPMSGAVKCMQRSR